jgi:glycosyltransferase involved in cell wall biosynthesis
MGGTEKFVTSLMGGLARDADFSLLFPLRDGFGLQTFWSGPDGLDGPDGRPTELQFLLPGAAAAGSAISDDAAGEALRIALDMYDFDAVHVQNLIGHSLAPLEVLAEFRGRVICSVHDLYLACPNHSLLYRGEEPCGIPDEPEVCSDCLASLEAVPGSGVARQFPELDPFRAAVRTHLDTVDHWVFPTQSAADYFLRVYDPDPARVEIVEHGALIRTDRSTRAPDPRLVYDEPLRVAFVGLGWPKKGFAVANELAEAFRGTDIEVHQFGEVREAVSAELRLHGPYDNEWLPELLHDAGIQIVLLPGAYAETFGLVMTEALISGLPVIGAGYGALGERIRRTGAGWTIDPTDHEEIRALIERIDACRDELMRTTARAAQVPLSLMREVAGRYARMYGFSGRRDRRG